MNKQCQRVLEYMQQHGEITQKEAPNELGIMRLASRISDLKKRGVPVQTERRRVMNRWGEKCFIAVYRLGGE